MILKSIADYFSYMTPQGASIYMLFFLGVVILSLSLSGGFSQAIPGYLVVFILFVFTIWYIYVKLIVPNPVQL
jgi:hypothetical protein